MSKWDIIKFFPFKRLDPAFGMKGDYYELGEKFEEIGE